ncbi:hypothetical protein BGZ63DRAFT_450055 [Mariannaea sp. PMI_226]|nr:hypothetical protein BGZ63DRAFT_450055 [Mariannaea sp. PMI_226]
MWADYVLSLEHDVERIPDADNQPSRHTEKVKQLHLTVAKLSAQRALAQNAQPGNADNSSPDLCKVIASAVALGYPAPVIVNWKTDFNTDEEGIGPSQLGKITGTLEYLKWATSHDSPEDERLGEDDLVMMLDAHDVWLQLPPSVLLNRYFKSNQRANRRLAEEYGFFDGELMKQSIIISAQKGCVAPRDSVSSLHCRDIPESTLPSDVYGFFTDWPGLKWKYTRPRYVNSGSFMGPVGDMRRYFHRVKETMDRDLKELGPKGELGGDQGIFAQVFGEQELWRQRIREEHWRNYQTSKEKEIRSQVQFEYHVGLDYDQDLFYPTCYAEKDGYFVALDNYHAVEDESRKLGLQTSRIHGVPEDISESDQPFAKLTGETGLNRSWGDVALYTDLWTTSIPVALHHNAWRDGLKSRRVTWWDKTWFFPYLRPLVEAHLHENKSTPLATLPARSGRLQVWPYDGKREQREPLLFGKDKLSKTWVLRGAGWDDVCRNSNETMEEEEHWYEEVFRDEKGPP